MTTNGWGGGNGQWYDHDELNDLHIKTEHSYFPGARGIVGCTDPHTGDIVYKDGATTGCTVGRIGLSEAVSFEPGTANIATGEAAPDVVRSKFLMLHSLDSKTNVCAPGDSGSSVFVPASQKDGWEWAGQLVSMLNMEEGPSVGLMIPQSKVFKALEENTGIAWRMFG